MSGSEFIFCNWQGRLWPAKILLKTGITPNEIPKTNSDCLDVQIICLDKRLRVKRIDTRPFEEEEAKSISSDLVCRENFTHEETLEELTYRKALRVALNILTGQDSDITQMTIKEPVMAKFGGFASEVFKKSACAFNSDKTKRTLKPNGVHLLQEQGRICTRQSSRKLSFIKKTTENERRTRSNTLIQSSIKTRNMTENKESDSVGKQKRGKIQKKPCCLQKGASYVSPTQSLQPMTSAATEKCRSWDKESKRLQEKEISSLKTCRSTISRVKEDQNGKIKKNKQKQRNFSKPPSDSSGSNSRSEEVSTFDISRSYLESTPKSRTCGNVRSYKFSHVLSSPKNIQSVKKTGLCKSQETGQHKRKRGKKDTELLDCLDTSASSTDLDQNVKSNNQSNEKSLTEIKSPPHHFKSSLFEFNLDGQISPIAACNQKHSHFNSPQSTCAATKITEGAFNPSNVREKEGTLSTSFETCLGSSSFEIDEVEQWSVTKGMLVWCKFQKYPHWPAVVRSVKPRIKKASILFIDENIINSERNKKGFCVSIRTLKPFDCEDRHQFTDAARHIYKNSIDWCVALIDDYRIRRGCGSFTGSFVEYCAAELSIPMRKSFGQDPLLMMFPYSSIASRVEDHSDSEFDTSSIKHQPCKKLLPDRKKAARDRANEKLVQFIVKARGVEKHLQAVIKGQKHSRWLEEFKTCTRNSNVIDTYLEDDWQVDKVITYLKSVYEMSARKKRLVDYERCRFILDVLLPEAIICAIAEVEQMSIKKAEEKYMKGPLHSEREVEHFNKEIEKEMKLKQQHLNEEDSTN
ncbi:PWWP domain-containing DNA repair factor 3A-like isoform X2 [Narcine bancroftii]|uniref:PWWP domain-containing DNA repair factor 3A-like isoform X2 n=1 Tax=Narcine bancroftii TaxID=1343680 RepID=UPI0038319262